MIVLDRNVIMCTPSDNSIEDDCELVEPAATIRDFENAFFVEFGNLPGRTGTDDLGGA